MPAKNESNEIKLTRIYDAPVEMVWNAWVDPKQAAKWWGPRGFTITTHSKDLRAGGHWKYTMHGPDGKDYPNYTIYHEVIPHARLVYDHGGSENSPPMFKVTVTFQEVKGKTKMDMTMALPSVEAARNTKKFIKSASGDSTWDRLAEYLADREGKERFVINRSFETPIQTMYQMWTDPKHFASWMGPTGSTTEFLRADIRPGGSSFYKMGMGNTTMFGLVHYLELTPPSRLVYTQSFVDEKENISRHPMSKTFPATMKTTVTFSEEGPGQTRVTLEWEPHGTLTAEELETFRNAKGGMTMGWTGSFDKLEEVLQK